MKHFKCWRSPDGMYHAHALKDGKATVFTHIAIDLPKMDKAKLKKALQHKIDNPPIYMDV